MRLFTLASAVLLVSGAAACGRLGFDASTVDGGAGGPTTLTFADAPEADVTGGMFDTFVLGSAEFEGHNMGKHYDVHVSGSAVGLIRFDVSAIPAGAEIGEAAIELVTGGDAPSGTTITAYRVLEEWSEGTQGWGVGVANWNERLGGIPWTAAGVGVGSRESSPIGSFTATAPMTPHRLTLDPGLVAGWVDDPASNHGIALLSATQYVEILSREYDVASDRPRLVVTFTP